MAEGTDDCSILITEVGLRPSLKEQVQTRTKGNLEVRPTEGFTISPAREAFHLHVNA